MPDINKAIAIVVNHIEWIKCTMGRFSGGDRLAEQFLMELQLKTAEKILSSLVAKQRDGEGLQ